MNKGGHQRLLLSQFSKYPMVSTDWFRETLQQRKAQAPSWRSRSHIIQADSFSHWSSLPGKWNNPWVRVSSEILTAPVDPPQLPTPSPWAALAAQTNTSGAPIPHCHTATLRAFHANSTTRLGLSCVILQSWTQALALEYRLTVSHVIYLLLPEFLI